MQYLQVTRCSTHLTYSEMKIRPVQPMLMKVTSKPFLQLYRMMFRDRIATFQVTVMMLTSGGVQMHQEVVFSGFFYKVDSCFKINQTATCLRIVPIRKHFELKILCINLPLQTHCILFSNFTVNLEFADRKFI